ncbi:MAG TPA: MFS transporter, partial [Bryobacteraceae bacterium]|nr:MFS transporter [Bryobacteraceae bacterium]
MSGAQPHPRNLEGNRNSPAFSFYLLGCALVAALGGLLFGFDTAVISGTTDALRNKFVLSDNLLGFTVASALIGTILGSISSGRPADAIGRRGALALLGVLYFISAVGCAFAWDWWSFLSFRFVGGLAVGGASVVSPLYIAEISPARYRGRLVAITQFNIVLGILLAYLSNYVIGTLHLGANEWRWMFGVMAAPAATFCLLIFLTPQSPRWLVARGSLAEARTVLQRCGSDTGSVEDEIREIQHSMDVAHHSLHEPFYCRRYRT